MMNAEAMPVIELHVRHMKQSIVNAMGVYGSELGDNIEMHVERAIKEYPFEEKVREAVFSAVDRAIEHHFLYGKGKATIYEAVSESIENAT